MPRKRPEEIRKEIRRVDGEILRLARKRIELAEEIGNWKLEHDIPVRDFEMEREILLLAEEQCKEHGLDPALGREIVKVLIAGAVKIQEDIRERRFKGTKKRISIVGGRGKMGSWFARYLYSRGHQVLVYDPAGSLRGFRSSRSLDRAVRDAEIILLSVPLHVAKETYRKVRRLKPAGTIVDNFSLKTPVLDEIRRSLDQGLPATSFHSLFGPDVYLLSDRNLLLCPCGHEGADAAVEELFIGTSLDLVRVPVEEHDKVMGIVLGLSHAVSIVFTEALARSGVRHRDLRRTATTTFLRQTEAACEVAHENPRLYYDIQHLNRYSQEVFGILEEALRTFQRASAHRNPSSFLSLMRRGRLFFEER